MPRDVKSSRPSTAQDVADSIGVSRSTVSRVLSGRGIELISEKTRQRVFEAAIELDYSPNPIARALRNHRTHSFGVVVRAINDPFFTQLIDVIGNIAKEHGYDLVFGFASNNPLRAVELADVLDARRCDGVFLIGDLKETVSDHRFIKRMAQDHLVVSLCRGSGILVESTASISTNNYLSTFAALNYLTQLGHRRIALVDGSCLGDIRERMNAYIEFIIQRDGEPHQEYIQSDEGSYLGGYRAAQRLLRTDPLPTAIFATEDVMAVGILKAASEMGYSVPQDLSLIGFGDINVAPFLIPALTTVNQQVEQIGLQAVSLMLDMVRAGAAPDPLPHLLVEPELIIRDSCAPPAR